MMRWMMVGLLLTGCAARQSVGVVTVPVDAAASCPTVQEHEALGLPGTEAYASLMGWTEVPAAGDMIELLTEVLPQTLASYEQGLSDEPASKWAAACAYTQYLSLFPAAMSPPEDLPRDLTAAFNEAVRENIQPLADDLKAKALFRAELAAQSDADWSPRAERLAQTLRQ